MRERVRQAEEECEDGLGGRVVGLGGGNANREGETLAGNSFVEPDFYVG